MAAFRIFIGGHKAKPKFRNFGTYIKIRKEKDKPNKSENSWISLVFCWNFYQQLIGKDYYYYSLVEDKFIIVMSI